MKLKIMGRCACGCGERVFFSFKISLFSVSWFTDCGEWFININAGRRYCRFSSCGYLSGRVRPNL